MKMRRITGRITGKDSIVLMQSTSERVIVENNLTSKSLIEVYALAAPVGQEWLVRLGGILTKSAPIPCRDAHNECLKYPVEK